MNGDSSYQTGPSRRPPIALIVGIIATVVLLAVAALVGWRVYQRYRPAASSAPTTPSQPGQPGVPAAENGGLPAEGDNGQVTVRSELFTVEGGPGSQRELTAEEKDQMGLPPGAKAIIRVPAATEDNPAPGAVVEVDPTTVPADSDRDGLFDEDEARLGTDPNDPDTDGDSYGDFQEVKNMGTDPLDPTDPSDEK